MSYVLLIQVLREAEAEGSPGLLASQPNLIGRFQVTERPCVKNQGASGGVPPEVVQWPPHVHEYLCTHT